MIFGNAGSMSNRFAGSILLTGIDDLFGRQDFMTPERVANCTLFHQVDLTAKNCGKPVQHLHPIIKGDTAIRCEAHQHIYIAVWAEVLPQNRPEQGEFFNFPPAAEVFDFVFRNINLGFRHKCCSRFTPPINADGRRLEVIHNASDFRLRLAKINQQTY